MLPAPYGAYPYIQSPQVLPAATVTAATTAAAITPGGARVPASYYHPIIYWPYPSPPVSPTAYYTHSGPTMVIIRGIPFSLSSSDLNYYNAWDAKAK